MLACDCVACGGRGRPRIYLEGRSAQRFDFRAPPLARRALLGAGIATGLTLLASTRGLARDSGLRWPGDDPHPQTPRWTVRARGTPPRGSTPLEPIGGPAPAAIPWPEGQTEHRLILENAATGESFDGIVWANGRFITEALARLNALMRDLHAGAVTRVDARLYDLLACLQLRVRKPFRVVSGYRTAQTNLALARHDRHVARNSFHILGKAVDFSVAGIAPRQLARQARETGAGGVGLYAGEDFVHIDTGPVRSWVY